MSDNPRRTSPSEDVPSSSHAKNARTALFRAALQRIFESSEFAKQGDRQGWRAVRKLLVEALGPTATANLANWRAGRALPSSKSLTALARIFGAQPESFFLREGEEGKVQLLSGPEIADLIARCGPETNVFLVLPESRFRNEAEETAKRLNETFASVLHEDGPRVSVLLTLPHEKPGGKGQLETVGKAILGRLRAFEKKQRALGKTLPFHCLFLDPAITPIDPLLGVRLFVDPGKETARLYQEVAVPVPGDRTGKHNLWAELKPQACEDSWELVRESVLGIASPTWNEDRLHVGDLKSFQRLFQEQDGRESYREIQKLHGPSEEMEAKFDATVDELLKKFKGNVKVLEVGAGDFGTSWKLLYLQFHQRDVPIHVTSVDPVPQDPCEDASHLRFRCIAKRVEKLRVNLNRFDLVIANHAIYRSDPSVLSKMLAYVRPGGRLLLLQATTKSFLSLIARAADDYVEDKDLKNLEQSKRQVRERFPGSFREESPFRVFGRELEDWFRRHRVTSSSLPLPSLVKRSLFFQGGQLTPAGTRLVQYFLGPKDVEKFMEARGEELLADLQRYEETVDKEVYLRHEELFSWVTRAAPSQAWLDGRIDYDPIVEITPAVARTSTPNAVPTGEERVGR